MDLGHPRASLVLGGTTYSVSAGGTAGRCPRVIGTAGATVGMRTSGAIAAITSLGEVARQLPGSEASRATMIRDDVRCMLLVLCTLNCRRFSVASHESIV